MAASAPTIILTLKPGGKSKEKEKTTPIILKAFPIVCVCLIIERLTAYTINRTFGMYYYYLNYYNFSVTESCLALQPHGLQHARLPCPSLSPSLLKLISIESVMLSKHLILCRPLLLLSSTFPSIRIFSSELALHIRWPKYWNLLQFM